MPAIHEPNGIPNWWHAWDRIHCLILREYWVPKIKAARTTEQFIEITRGVTVDLMLHDDKLVRAIGGEWSFRMESQDFRVGDLEVRRPELRGMSLLRACAERLVPEHIEYHLIETCEGAVIV